MYGEERSDVWTMYVAIGAWDADYLNWTDMQNTVNISTYNYPLYVGYFYTEDSKIIQWKCFVPLAEKAMRDWAVEYSKPSATISNTIFHESATLGSKDFTDVASGNIVQYTPLFVIKTTKGKLPDIKWTPRFKHQYPIDIDLSKLPKDPFSFQRDNALTHIIKDHDAFKVLN